MALVFVGNSGAQSYSGGGSTGPREINSTERSMGANFGSSFGKVAPGGRSSFSSWRAFRAEKVGDGPGGTTQIGPVSIGISTGLKVMYNTNINSSPDNPVGDFVFVPSLNLNFVWPLTSRNVLNFNLQASYDYYLQNSQYARSSFNIDPGTIVNFKLFVGDFVFTFYDTPSIINEPPTDEGFVNVTDFSQLNNTIGLSVLWDLNKLLLTLTGERGDMVSLNNNFTSQNSVEYSLIGSALYNVTPTFQVGLRGSVTRLEYEENVLAGYQQYMVGLVLNTDVTRYTNISFEAGLQLMDFNDTSSQSNQTAEFVVNDQGETVDIAESAGGGNYFGPYMSFGAFNRLNRFYTHGLSFSYQAQAGSFSNYQQNLNISYVFTYRLNSRTEIFGSIGWENSFFSGSDVGSLQNWSGNLNLRYRLFRDLSLTFGYEFMSTIGQEELQSFEQNIFYLGMEYAF